MLDWIQQNISIINSASSVFTLKNGIVDKTVKLLKVSPQIVELDNFFEDNVTIFFVTSLVRHTIELKIISLTDRGSTLFEPISHEESEIKRTAERIDLLAASKPITLSHMISDFEIAAQIDFHDSKIERISYIYSQALKKYFSNVEIYFFHEIMTSARGKLIKEFQKTMFIMDVNEATAQENDLPGTIPSEVFFKRIKPYDRKIPAQTLMDITVPIFYKNVVPYGFIHVNTPKQYPPAILKQLKNVASKLNEQLLLAKIIPVYESPVKAIDISLFGLGVAFTDRKLVTILKNDAMMFGELHFPGERTYPMTAFVRNISNVGKGTLRGGLEFYNLNPEFEAFLFTFISAFTENSAKEQRGKQ